MVLDVKEMLKNGYSKKQVCLFIDKDINGKEHFLIVDDAESAKQYKLKSAQYRTVTMLVKTHCSECGEALGEDKRCYNNRCKEYDPISQYFDYTQGDNE